MKLKNLENDTDISLAIIQIDNAPKCYAGFYLRLYLTTLLSYFKENRKYWGEKLPSAASEDSIKELLIDFQAWQLDRGYLNNKNLNNGMVKEYLNSTK